MSRLESSHVERQIFIEMPTVVRLSTLSTSLIFQCFICLCGIYLTIEAVKRKRLTVQSSWDINNEYEFTQLVSNTANRSVVNNLATMEEIILIRELLEASEFMFYKSTIPGNTVLGMNHFLIHSFQPKSPKIVRYYRQKDRELRRYKDDGYSNSSNIELNSAPSSRLLLSGMKHGYHRRYLKAMATMLKLIERIADYTDTAFGTSVVVDEASLFIRTTNEETKERGFQEFLHINHTYWNHNAHCDACALEFAVDGVDCRVSTVYKSNLDFSAVLYLNEVEGGEFGFIELPQSTAKEKRKGAKYYSSPDRKTNSNQRNLRSDGDGDSYIRNEAPPGYVPTVLEPPMNRSLLGTVQKAVKNTVKSQSTKPVEKRTRGNNAYYDTYVYKYARIRQYIAPSPGKLVIFSSGIENVHGVTEILGEGTKRYSLNMWLRKIDNKLVNSMSGK